MRYGDDHLRFGYISLIIEGVGRATKESGGRLKYSGEGM